MKKPFLLLLCVTYCFFVKAQSDSTQYFAYGVDFSQAKVFGAMESADQFAEAFKGINMLLITEPEKYDFSRIVNAEVNVDIEPIMQKLSLCKYENLISLRNRADSVDCASIVKSYQLTQKQGTGIVLIAKLLDKSKKEAIYDLVTFDIASREILVQREVKGKTFGFGLRNYWAGSVNRAIRSFTLYQKK